MINVTFFFLNTILFLIICLLIVFLIYITYNLLFYKFNLKQQELKANSIDFIEEADKEIEMLTQQANLYNIEAFRERQRRDREFYIEDEDGLSTPTKILTRDELGFVTGVE